MSKHLNVPLETKVNLPDVTHGRVFKHRNFTIGMFGLLVEGGTKNLQQCPFIERSEKQRRHDIYYRQCLLWRNFLDTL
jgi:hypothetical protein